jgi:hypothetical protein
MLLLDPRACSPKSDAKRLVGLVPTYFCLFQPIEVWSSHLQLGSYTLIIDVKLVWDDFIDFYAIIYSNETLKSYALFKYLGLTYFLKSWDWYRRLHFIPLIGFNQMFPSCWKLRLGGKRQPCCLYTS